MGFIRRLKRITAGRIEALLASVEDPERLLPILVAELDQQVRQAARAEAKALSAVRSAQRQMDECTGRAARMEKGASLAMQAGQLDTARAAVAAQIDAERQRDAIARSLETATAAQADAAGARVQLQEQLLELRHRSRQLVARSRQARIGAQVLRNSGDVVSAGRSILDEVTRMEARVQEDEAKVDAQGQVTRELAVDLPEHRLRQLERDAEVDRRLAQIKQQMKAGVQEPAAGGENQ